MILDNLAINIAPIAAKIWINRIAIIKFVVTAASLDIISSIVKVDRTELGS